MSESHEAISERLRLTREALGLSQVELCRRTGISTTTWNNYEKGINRISLDEAFKLKRRLSVSLDWIYFGDEAMLPARVIDGIRRPRGQEGGGAHAHFGSIAREGKVMADVCDGLDEMMRKARLVGDADGACTLFDAMTEILRLRAAQVGADAGADLVLVPRDQETAGALFDEVVRLRAENARLREAMKFVHWTFSMDIAQGYRTKDKTFAVGILGQALETFTRLEPDNEKPASA